MELQEIKESLCYYDLKNPYCTMDVNDTESIKYLENKRLNGECYCDNCFYGRTLLAEELLRVKRIYTISP